MIFIESVLFFSSGIEISRGNSLPCDAELRALLGGIPDIETDSVAILPSPRVSPDIFHDIPGLAVTSESEDNSGKNQTKKNDIELWPLDTPSRGQSSIFLLFLTFNKL